MAAHGRVPREKVRCGRSCRGLRVAAARRGEHGSQASDECAAVHHSIARATSDGGMVRPSAKTAWVIRVEAIVRTSPRSWTSLERTLQLIKMVVVVPGHDRNKVVDCHPPIAAYPAALRLIGR